MFIVSLEPLYWRIYTILIPGKSFLPFFNPKSLSTSFLRSKTMYINFVFFYLFLWNLSLFFLRIVQSILQRGITWMLTLLIRIQQQIIVSSSGLLIRSTFFFHFLSYPLDSVCFQYSQIILFFCLQVRRSFPSMVNLFLMLHRTFYNAAFHFYIQAAYSYNFHQGLAFFWFLVNILISSVYIRWLIFPAILVWVCWVLWLINLGRLFNAKSIFM